MSKSLKMGGYVVALAVIYAGVAFAHHGTGISYDMEHPWTTTATVVEFRYQNPHPSLIFERKNEKGETEHWVTEIPTSPSFLIHAGWTKARSEEALKPGTIITVTVCTSKAGGTSGVATKIVNGKGEQIVNSREGDNPLNQSNGGGN
ncbi:MAG: DUF6152 family protein [Acidobacteriota bacterium]|nr:DUF6152 family protein [Acidobacteriota bacterium]